ncbi:MAG TPA: hypothetical protein VFX39_07430 [Gemmatimonadaceae bacterium]|nr:hypothetical protein [Gemmatimonadaceae bacterium]
MRAICVGRHPYLSEHYARFFGHLGLETESVVGLEAAARIAAQAPPDLLLCEFNLLTQGALASWERDAILGTIPVIAVSLTSRPEEVPLLDAHGVAGFLYLPTLRPDVARRVLRTSGPPPGFALRSSFGSAELAPSAAHPR